VRAGAQNGSDLQRIPALRVGGEALRSTNGRTHAPWPGLTVPPRGVAFSGTALSSPALAQVIRERVGDQHPYLRVLNIGHTPEQDRPRAVMALPRTRS
jgi:hypothetical protein